MPHPFDAFQAARLAWWDAFLNRMQGRIEDLGRMGPTDLKQHAIAPYLKLCEKNRTAKPF
jgi:hypothetical protein